MAAIFELGKNTLFLSFMNILCIEHVEGILNDTYIHNTSARQLNVYIVIIITTSTTTVSAIRCGNSHWVSAR